MYRLNAARVRATDEPRGPSNGPNRKSGAVSATSRQSGWTGARFEPPGGVIRVFEPGSRSKRSLIGQSATRSHALRKRKFGWINGWMSFLKGRGEQLHSNEKDVDYDRYHFHSRGR